MKTLTLNNKRILFGMLVMTLGFSKSWFQAADGTHRVDMASSELSQTNPTTVLAAKKKRTVVVNGKDYDFNYSLTNITVKEPNFENGVINGTVETKMTVATVTDDDELSVKIEFDEGIADKTDLFAKLDIGFKKAKEQQLKDRKDKEERDRALAACEIDEDDTDLLEDKNSKKYYSCKARKIRDLGTREERREAFRTEIVADIQNRLMTSTTAAERSEILASIKTIQSEVGYSSELRSDLKMLEKGARAMVAIPGLALDTAQNPENALENSLAIDRLAWEFNFKNNTQLSRYSEGTQDVIRGWASSIMPMASQAQKSPEVIARQFFESGNEFSDGLTTIASDGTVVRNDDSNPGSTTRTSSSGSRGERVHMGGMQYIPRYLDVSSNNNLATNQRNNYDYRDNRNGYDPNYSTNNRDSNYRGNGYDTRFAQNNGNRNNYQDTRYAPNNYSSTNRYAYQPGTQYQQTQQFGPGYQRGGVPQAGSRY